MKLVVTHSAKGHVDDFLSLVILKATNIKRVAITTPVKKYPDAIWVDIGKVLDYDKGYLDHHQDKDLPAAFIHAAKYAGIELKGSLWNYFSDVDTKGPKIARKLHNYNDEKAEELWNLWEPILLAWDNYNPEGSYKGLLFSKLHQILEENDYSLDKEIIKQFNEVVSGSIPHHYKEAKKQINQEKKLKKKAVREGRKLIHKGYKFFINYYPTVYFTNDEVGADVILVLNERSDKPSFIVDTEKLHVKEVVDALNLPTTFIHASGFLAVIDMTFTQLHNQLVNK